MSVKTDLTNASNIEDFITRIRNSFPKVDILINNAVNKLMAIVSSH